MATTKLNHFAISAALGSMIGPVVRASHGQIASPQLASTIANLQHRRRFLQGYEQEASASNIGRHYFDSVKAAFLAVRQQQSVERVIVDPSQNRRFIEACRRDFGIEDNPFHLNMALLRLRKMGELRNLRSVRTRIVTASWRYAFASEMAAQAVFYRHGASVDTMLCHPDLVRRFDHIAEKLAPGFTQFEYRWAALNIRKKGTRLSRSVDADKMLDWSSELPFHAVESVPEEEGLYSLHEGASCLLIASSDDLRESVDIGQHIAEFAVFDSGLWEPDPRRLRWRYAGLEGTESEVRYGLVRRLVARWKPVFNVPRGVRSAA